MVRKAKFDAIHLRPDPLNRNYQSLILNSGIARTLVEPVSPLDKREGKASNLRYDNGSLKENSTDLQCLHVELVLLLIKFV